MFLSHHELLSNFGETDSKFEATQVKIYMPGMLEDLQCNGSDSREQNHDKASMSGWACKYTWKTSASQLMWVTAHPQKLLSTCLQAGESFITLHVSFLLQCDGEPDRTCWQKFESSKIQGRLKLGFSGIWAFPGQEYHHTLVGTTGQMNWKEDEAQCQTSHQNPCVACKNSCRPCRCAKLFSDCLRGDKSHRVWMRDESECIKRTRKKVLVYVKHTQLRILPSRARLQTAWDWAVHAWRRARRAAPKRNSEPDSAALQKLSFTGIAATPKQSQVTENISSAGTQNAVQQTTLTHKTFSCSKKSAQVAIWEPKPNDQPGAIVLTKLELIMRTVKQGL